MPATESNDLTIDHPTIALVGRLMFTLIFFLSGITHFRSSSRSSSRAWR